MEKGLEILVSELQKQNQILQTARQEAEEKTKLAEESELKTKEEFKHLQFLYDQLKRLMFGAKRERFIANVDVNQMTLDISV